MGCLLSIHAWRDIKNQVSDFVSDCKPLPVTGILLVNHNDMGIRHVIAANLGRQTIYMGQLTVEDFDASVLHEFSHVRDRIDSQPPIVSQAAGRPVNFQEIANNGIGCRRRIVPTNTWEVEDFFYSEVALELILSRIVETSERAGNKDRLAWDIVKVPHHSSYSSLGPEKGKQVTRPVPGVQRLYEVYGHQGGIIVSPSKVIPDSDETLPPHRQAAAYYKGAARKLSANFIVTMEHPSKQSPKPVNLKVSGRGQGVAVERVAPSTSAAVAATPPRAGDCNYV